MKALLLVAHGSRLAQSNREVHMLADKLKSKCSEHYQIIHVSFLELTTPLIEEGVKRCIDEGATSIVLLPYFLNSGRHVQEDIPNNVSPLTKLYPQIKIDIAPHIGSSNLMTDLLLQSAINS